MLSYWNPQWAPWGLTTSGSPSQYGTSLAIDGNSLYCAFAATGTSFSVREQKDTITDRWGMCKFDLSGDIPTLDTTFNTYCTNSSHDQARGTDFLGVRGSYLYSTGSQYFKNGATNYDPPSYLGRHSTSTGIPSTTWTSNLSNIPYELIHLGSDQVLVGSFYAMYSNTYSPWSLYVSTSTALYDSSGNITIYPYYCGGGVQSLARIGTTDCYVGSWTTVSHYNGTSIDTIYNRNYILLTGSSGTTDLTGSTGFDRPPYVVKACSDGYFYIAGSFSSYEGNSRDSLCKINTSGTLQSFSVDFDLSGQWYPVFAIEDNGSDSIYVAGYFTSVDSHSTWQIAKISYSGTVDTNFAVAQGDEAARITYKALSTSSYGSPIAYHASSNTLFVAGFFKIDYTQSGADDGQYRYYQVIALDGSTGKIKRFY